MAKCLQRNYGLPWRTWRNGLSILQLPRYAQMQCSFFLYTQHRTLWWIIIVPFRWWWMSLQHTPLFIYVCLWSVCTYLYWCQLEHNSTWKSCRNKMLVCCKTKCISHQQETELHIFTDLIFFILSNNCFKYITQRLTHQRYLRILDLSCKQIKILEQKKLLWTKTPTKIEHD